MTDLLADTVASTPPAVQPIACGHREVKGFSQRGTEGHGEGVTAALHDLTGFVLNASIKLHRDFGPFLLESVYEQVLAASLTRQGHAVQRQQTIDIVHDGLHIPGAFRADLVVDDLLLIEIKSIARLAPIHTRQVLTYLRLMKLDVGLLINFGGETLKEGFKRLTVASVPSVPSVRS